MDDIFRFGEESAEDAIVISADINLGPFYINRGTSYAPELEQVEGITVDMESLSREIASTAGDSSRHRVVFFDDLEDCVQYYKDNMKYYEEVEAVRVAGTIKEIDLLYKRARIEINPRAIFKHPENPDSRYILYIRGLTEWRDNKIYYTRIYSYDLVLVNGGDHE